MIYINPKNVTSPKDLVEVVKVLHDGGDSGVSVAQLKWDGVDCLGMRWNIAQREWDVAEKISNTKSCVGMPSSRGHSVWFILPDDLYNKNSELYKDIQAYL